MHACLRKLQLPLRQVNGTGFRAL